MEVRWTEQSMRSMQSHELMLSIHSRALACHCECLGMNAENSWAVCANTTPPYNVGHYGEVMQKWGLINEKGEPII
uniref:Uncharacterized protein n=1 Tax=viral metagenome TaxID=1070528 RepID=A0A6M3L8T2_9ZZZZ